MPSAKTIKLTLPALHQQQALFVNDSHRVVVATCGSKTGKAIDVTTPIPTPSGLKAMLDIEVGDSVFDAQGQPVTVTYVSPVYIGNTCYKVTFVDGECITADADHLWQVTCVDTDCSSVLTTQQLAMSGVSTLGSNGYNSYRWRIQIAKPLSGHAAQLPLDPYLFGTWLGDGGAKWATISSADDEILNAWKEGGFIVRHRSNYDYGITGHTPFDRSCSLNSILRRLGVKDNKHVPDAYLRSSVPQRIALLQGLLDTDGSSENGSAVFYNTNKCLADQVYELAAGLGCVATWREKAAILNGKHYGQCYCVRIRAPFQPFRLKRKASTTKVGSRQYRTISSITPTDSVPVKCIAVNSESHLYLAGRTCVVTHNTYGMSIWLARYAWNHRQSLSWFTAPTLRQARTAFNLIGLFLPPSRVKVNRNEMTYVLVRSDGRPHSTIEFRSADNPSSLRGEGVHACVVDEAAYWSRASYESIWTTLTRTEGLLRVISTPKGRNWFYDEWCKGSSDYAALHAKFPQYQSYKLPTSCNPYIKPHVIQQFKDTMPEDVFRQEIEAEFLDESAGVFRNITNCQTAQLYDNPVAGHRYVVGADLAKHHDFTVFVVCDVATRQVVHIRRFNETDWTLNVSRLRALANKWNNAWVLLDSTGVGDVIFDELASVYPNTAGFSISTNAAKAALIQKTQMALEQGSIGVPKPSTQNTAEQRELAQVMDDELRQYSYHLSAQGKFQFSAPDGFHDDAVIALCLANWQMSAPLDHYRARQVPGV